MYKVSSHETPTRLHIGSIGNSEDVEKHVEP